MGDRFYIPINPPMPLDQLMQIPLQQWQHRTLDNPDYPGADAFFNWRSMVNIDIADPALRTQTEEMFDQMASTPEGQRRIRQAYGLQKAQENPTANLWTVDHPRITVRTDPRVDGAAARMDGIIFVNPTTVTNAPYEGADGTFHRASLNTTLYHELGHLNDPFIVLPAYKSTRIAWQAMQTTQCNAILAQAGLDPSKPHANSELSSNLRTALAEWREQSDSNVEYPVMYDTNDYASRYFHEAPRAHIHLNEGHRPSAGPLPANEEAIHHHMFRPPGVAR